MGEKYDTPEKAAETSIQLLHEAQRGSFSGVYVTIDYINTVFSPENRPIAFEAKDGLGNTALHYAAMIHPDIERGIPEREKGATQMLLELERQKMSKI